MGASESRLDQTQMYKSTVGEREDTEFLKKVVTPGYGEVKIYTDQKQIHKWAVKQRVFQDKDEYEEFCEILENLQSIDNPYMVNIQRVHKSFQSEYCSNFYKVYIAFDYHKLTLSDQIQYKKDQKSNFSEESLYKLLICTGSGLNFMNKFDIAHENIKPETILVDSSQKLYKLTNIKFMTQNMSNYQSFLTGMDDTCYLAPEQMESLKRRDHSPAFDFQRTEVFSLGLVVLEAGTFEDIQELYNFDDNSFNSVKLEEYLQKFEKTYSKNLTDFLRKMLAIEPEQRVNLKDLEEILMEVDQQYGYTLYKSTHDPVNRTFFETQILMGSSKNKFMYSSRNQNQNQQLNQKLPTSKFQGMETSKVLERYQPQIVSTQRIIVNPQSERQDLKQVNQNIDENEKENYNSSSNKKNEQQQMKKSLDFKKKQLLDQSNDFDEQFDNIEHEISEHHVDDQKFPQYQQQSKAAENNNIQLEQSIGSIKKSTYSITSRNNKASPQQNQLQQDEEPLTYYHSKQTNSRQNTYKKPLQLQHFAYNNIQKQQQRHKKKPSLSSMGIGDVSPINQKYSPYNNSRIIKHSQYDMSLQSIKETQIDQSLEDLNTDQFEVQLNQIKDQAQKNNYQIQQNIQKKQREYQLQHSQYQAADNSSVQKPIHTKKDNIELMNSYSEQGIKTKQLRDKINMENSQIKIQNQNQHQKQQAPILSEIQNEKQKQTKIQHSRLKPDTFESNIENYFSKYDNQNQKLEKKENHEIAKKFNQKDLYSENNFEDSLLDQEALQQKFEKLNAKLENLEEQVQQGNKKFRMSYLLASNHFGNQNQLYQQQNQNQSQHKMNQSNTSRHSGVIRHSKHQTSKNNQNNDNYNNNNQRRSSYQQELQMKLKSTLPQRLTHQNTNSYY